MLDPEIISSIFVCALIAVIFYVFLKEFRKETNEAKEKKSLDIESPHSEFWEWYLEFRRELAKYTSVGYAEEVAHWFKYRRFMHYYLNDMEAIKAVRDYMFLKGYWRDNNEKVYRTPKMFAYKKGEYLVFPDEAGPAIKFGNWLKENTMTVYSVSNDKWVIGEKLLTTNEAYSEFLTYYFDKLEETHRFIPNTPPEDRARFTPC